MLLWTVYFSQSAALPQNVQSPLQNEGDQQRGHMFFWYRSSRASTGLSKHGSPCYRRFADFQGACARGGGYQYASMCEHAMKHLRDLRSLERPRRKTNLPHRPEYAHTRPNTHRTNTPHVATTHILHDRGLLRHKTSYPHPLHHKCNYSRIETIVGTTDTCIGYVNIQTHERTAHTTYTPPRTRLGAPPKARNTR